MKNIIIVGAGGFASELVGYINGDISRGRLTQCIIKGFLDISEAAFNEMDTGYVYLGSEDSYEVEKDDVFLIAIGNIDLKEKVVGKLLDKKANFMKYIHSSVIVDENSLIGEGVVICPYSMVNSNAKIGDFSMMNIYSSVAHDSILGKYSILSPYSTINGNVEAGDKLFMSTRSTILPGLSIGSSAVISAGTVVSKNMADDVMAFQKSRTTYVERRDRDAN